VKAGKVEETRDAETEQWVRDLVALYQEQMSFGAEIFELTEMFFKKEIDYSEEAKAVLAEEQVPEVLKAFAEEISSLEEFSADEIKAATKAVQKATGQKGKKLFMPIRVATTGETHGPELPKAISLLGKETVLARLESIYS
jgi:nondiscriminating glutamyl-tRNA synthetase